MYFSDNKQADIIDAFNTTSRYLDDILNINNIFFDNILSQICPLELPLYKANISDTNASILNLHLDVSNDIASININFTINVTILILKYSISLYLIVMFLALHPLELIFLNSSDSLEHPAMIQTSLWNFETIRGSLMKPKWQKQASLVQEICTI